MNKISNMPGRLAEMIQQELHNVRLYRVLSRSAPNDRDRQTLEEFSDDCQDTADEFMRMYRKMTGYPFHPEPIPLKENGSYQHVLHERIREEIRLSKRYRHEYLNTGDNYSLRRTFFNAYHTALEHAVGIMELLH